MKTFTARFLLVLFFLLSSFNANAQSTSAAAIVDRSLALESISQTDTASVLRPLFQMARTGNDTELLEALASIEEDPSMAPAAKDYVIFNLAVGLSDLPPNAVSNQVLEFLESYQVKTLVNHHDRHTTAVPLFNVRAAVAGLRNNWDRQQALVRSDRLLQTNVDQWISSYLSASAGERRGFLDALDFASPAQLRELGLSSLAQLDDFPELTLITANAALISGDIELLENSLTAGSGPGVSEVLARSSRLLSIDQSIRLLDHCLRLDSDAKAALAMAHLAPPYLDQPEVQQMLFGTLSDRNRGAGAALVLGQSNSPEIQYKLREIAAKDKGLAGQRAEMAVESRRANKEAEL
mgnify:FL=1